jgi:sugar/nucleoside kinase (ribokinase family)
MSGPRLIVFGCLTTDNVVTAEGRLLPQSFGGNCLYAALGARVWSDRVGVVSRYGAGYSETPIDLLGSLGIDTQGVKKLDVPHGRNVAFAYRADGSRTRRFASGLIERIPAEERARFIDTSLLPDSDQRWRQFAPDDEDVPPGWWESVAGVHCAFMPVSKHLRISRAVRARCDRRVWVQVDSPWHDGKDAETDHATPLFSQIDALLPSEDDVEAFRPGAPIEQTALALLESGAGALVLKIGAAGCRLFRRGEGRIAEIGAVPVVARDPTGAGDAFCGGFLAGMDITGDVVAAARYGAVSASFAVEAHGWAGLLAGSGKEAADRLRWMTTKQPL